MVGRKRGSTGLVTLLTAVLVLLLTAAPASADSVCSTLGCESKTPFAKGTQLKASANTPVTFIGLLDTISCKSSSIVYELTQNVYGAGKGFPIVAVPTSETFGECTSATLGVCSSFKVTKSILGIKWLANTTVAGRGYASSYPGSMLGFEYACGGTTCAYGTAKEAKWTHDFVGGNPAYETWQEPFSFVSGVGWCSGGMRSEGARTFSSPVGGIYWNLG